MDFSLARLTNMVTRFVGSFNTTDHASIIGLDIGTASIKIVQIAEKKGTAVLETYGEIALGPYAEAEVGQSVQPPVEKVAAALTDLMREATVTARRGGVAVPLSASLISVISLPTRKQDELAAMVPIEARKYIPVPVSEVALDWFAIPESEARFLGAQGSTRNPNATDVLLVAIHNQVLQRFESILTSASLSPAFFEIEPFAIGRAAYEHGTAPTMVIDLGASGTRMYVIEFGIVDVSHSISRGGQDITLALAKSKSLSFAEAEALKREQGVLQDDVGRSTFEFAFSEARRIFLAYQRKEGKAISRVVLVGGGAAMPGIVDMARTYFDAPVSVANPFERVAAPAFIGDVLTSAGPSFASAVGLALRGLTS